MITTWRLWIITAAIFGTYAALISNVYNLQVNKGSYYLARAASQSRVADFLAAQRGSIYFTDKNDNLVPAAINREYPVIFAVPKEIADPDEAAQSLASILGTTATKVKTLLDKPNDLYELLVEKATDEQVGQIKTLGLKGVY